MPALHRYKCLNYDRCPSYKSPSMSNFFAALNSPIPECPHCGCRKLEDGGPDCMFSASDSVTHGHTKNSDTNFRRTAERYGLSDMNNKGGQAIKRAAPTPKMDSPLSGQTVKVGGYDLPFGAGCHNMPGMAQKIPTAPLAVKAPPSAMMNKMTRVVGEHKA